MSGKDPTTLRGNTLSVFSAVAMCMAFMGPATSVAFNTGQAASGAGYAVPLSILLAMIACLLVANTIAGFARKLPTAGFAYTYNSHGFGPSGGFLSGWLLLLTYGMVGPMLFAALGNYSAMFVKELSGSELPWQLFSVVFVLIVWIVNSLGVSSSARTALVFLVLEVGVLLGLAATILAKGGDAGISLAPFDPMHSTNGIGGIGTGMLWGILMFIGFESVSTLGEEAKSAKRSIPLALFSAVLVIGVFYVFMTYTASIGFGPENAHAIAADSPWSALVHRYWGITWIFTLTVLISQFANVVSGSNAIVRVLFSMGREHVLPRLLGRVSKRGVPQFAITAYLGFALVFTIGVGSAIGALGVYSFAGTLLGLGMVLIYMLMSIGLIRFYYRKHRNEFSVFRHAVLPVLTVALMLLPIYGQLIPFPGFPDGLAPILLVSWMIVGGIYLAIAKRKQPEVLSAMGRVFEETEEKPSDERTPTRT
ncbi:APC family permease [Sciscionella marina]|uniref:APC family permease n=1 Tax=Sciscionella marina TaxID=508770 RepID=UPI0003762612|nr:APC family permease [Sciscionella marina]